MHEDAYRYIGTLHEEKSNIDDDGAEPSNRKKTMKSTAAGGCHYNTYKCLRPRYQSHPFWYNQAHRGLLSFKHTYNEGISSHSVRLNYQPEPRTSNRRPRGRPNIPASLFSPRLERTRKPLKLAYVTLLSLHFKTGVTIAAVMLKSANLYDGATEIQKTVIKRDTM